MIIVLTIAVTVLAVAVVILYGLISLQHKTIKNLLSTLEEQENINQVCFMAIADLQQQFIESKTIPSWSGPIGEA